MNWLNPTLLFLAAFVGVFLEACFGLFRHLLGAQIDVLPALMVYAALRCSLPMMTSLAVAGGLWFDSLSANPLGVTVLPLFLVGLVIQGRRDLILRDQTYAHLVLGFAASAIVPMLTLLLLLSTRQRPLLGWGSVWQWFVVTVGGGFLTPLAFMMFDGLNRALIYRPASQTSFRPDREIRRGRS